MTGPVQETSDTLTPSGPRLLFYAERPRRRMLQVLVDGVVVAWTVLGVSLAVALHDLVLMLQSPARGLAQAGDGVRGAFSDAAGVADDIPFVGGRLGDALGNGTTAGQSLVDAGNQQVQTVASVATGLAWVLVLVGVVPVVGYWLVRRVGWILRARDAVYARAHDVDLLALRALTSASPGRLRRAAPDAAGAWRRADPYALARLADVELARIGLRGPTAVTTSGAASGAPAI